MQGMEVLGFSLGELLYYFFLYSLLGWIMETTLVSVREHRFVNRGFLNGPLCPIYGVGMCLIIVALTPYQDRLTDLFLGGMLLASALEYVTGWLLEKLFHAKWWDYSDKRCNLHGRICLRVSLAWGVLALVIIKLVQPAVTRLVASIPAEAGRIVLYGLLFLFFVDAIQSVWTALQLSKKIRSLDRIKEELRGIYESSNLYENGEELRRRLENSRLSELFAELSGNFRVLNQQGRKHFEQLKQKYSEHLSLRSRSVRRMMKAFPGMRSARFHQTLSELREHIGDWKRK